MPRDLVKHFLSAVDTDAVMSAVAGVSTFDRYQGSTGIEQAATYIAELAEATGLAEVTIDRYPADGNAQWWSFSAPTSWTPLIARFSLPGDRDSAVDVDHARHPFAIATHSAATSADDAPRALRTLGSPRGELAGAIIALDAFEFARGDVLGELESAGAAGFVTDGPARRVAEGHRGRIELPAGTRLFGFSLEPDEFDRVRAAADRQESARAIVTLGGTATMPVVTAALPGDEATAEMWLMAHLCHPRPGANDNASGVGAVLGVADALVRARKNGEIPRSARGTRFVWGPEFVGTAAMIHRGLTTRFGTGLPSTVLNLDMVGEDQSVCGSPFVVERPPDHLPSPLTPITEYVVAEVFAQTAHRGERWEPSPFLGFSDHALFADPAVGRAAVQFCHPGDRFNHSAGDALDKVSPREMLRSTAAAATITHLLTRTVELGSADTIALVERWCSNEAAAARRTARRHEGTDAGAWSAGLLEHVGRRNSAIGEALRAPLDLASSPAGSEKNEGGTWERHWQGPLNIRAMLGDATPASRRRVTELVAADKRNLALLLNLGIRVDGRHTEQAIFAEVSYNWGEPLNAQDARLLFDVLLESGWISPPTTTAGAGSGTTSRGDFA